MDKECEKLLCEAYHRGRFAEVNEKNQGLAANLVECGCADYWRTSLGKDAIRITDHGSVVARGLELEY